MNISLTTELEEFVRAQVASGHYTSASEVIREALRTYIRAEAKQGFTSRIELSRRAYEANDVIAADNDYFDHKIQRLKAEHGLP